MAIGVRQIIGFRSGLFIYMVMNSNILETVKIINERDMKTLIKMDRVMGAES